MVTEHISAKFPLPRKMAIVGFAITLTLVLLTLAQPTLGIGTLAGIVGYLVYRRYPVIMISLLPSTITVGEIFHLVILGYTYEVSLTEIAIILMSLYILIEKWERRDSSFRLTTIGFLLLFYVSMQVISILWVWDISRTLVALRILIFHIILFWLVVNRIKTPRDFQQALRGLPLAAFIIALQLLFVVNKQGGLFSGDITNRTQIITPAGPWVTLSAMIFLSVPITSAFILINKTPIIRKILTIVLMISIGAGFLALGKIEIFALIVGSVFFLRKIKMQRKTSWLPIVLIFVILLAWPLRGYTEAFWERIINFKNSDSLEFRLEEWRVGWENFLTKPFLGIGAGNLKVLFQKKHSCHCATEANNALLHILVEFGIAGLLLTSIFIRDIWFRLKKLNTETIDSERIIVWGLSASVLMILIISLAEVTFVSLNFGTIFWYLIALITTRTEKNIVF